MEREKWEVGVDAEVLDVVWLKHRESRDDIEVMVCVTFEVVQTEKRM